MNLNFTIKDQEEFNYGIDWAKSYHRNKLKENAIGMYQNGVITQDFLNGFFQGLENEDQEIIDDSRSTIPPEEIETEETL